MLAPKFIKRTFSEFFDRYRLKELDLSGKEIVIWDFSDNVHRGQYVDSPEELEFLFGQSEIKSAHASIHSFEYPWNPKLQDKGRIKYNLVFDFDKGGIYDLNFDFLDELKLQIHYFEEYILRRTLKLKTQIYFSGSKGFHIYTNLVNLSIVQYNNIISLISMSGIHIDEFITDSLTGVETPYPEISKGILESQEKNLDRIKNLFFGYLEYMDYAVLTDPNKLLKLPNTIHPKTGLKGVRVFNLLEFDPVRDAQLYLMDKTLIVNFKKEMINFMLGRERLSLTGQMEIPFMVAVNLALRGDLKDNQIAVK